jgi:hypothetical protein
VVVQTALKVSSVVQLGPNPFSSIEWLDLKIHITPVQESYYRRSQKIGYKK